jgi:gamma-glutamyl-gamma-aminobutyrate hydrolase PuuD
MRILITQSEIKRPPFFFASDYLERSWYSLLNKHELIPAPNLPNKDFDTNWDCLVITGGSDSIDRYLTENKLFKMADDNNKPIIGFCHGAFVINELAGGINSSIDNHAGVDHNVYMEESTHTVNSYHSQYISRLASNFESIATDKDGNCEAFQHQSKLQWGVLWHPERMINPLLPSQLSNFLNSF